VSAPLVVVTGTGTGIGKTFLAAALVAAWAGRGRRIAGVKPIESGVDPRSPEGTDAEALAAASTFHVTQPRPYVLAAGLSPHLAARLEGATIDLDAVVDWLEPVRAAADGVVLELPGGLFSPLADRFTNADLVRKLVGCRVVLVAPDRLGVLHDVIAAVRAAAAEGVEVDALVLSEPANADASTGRNAGELARVLPGVQVAATLLRGPASERAIGRVLEAVGVL
jgi:dethiobiotin synthetase